MLSWMFGAAPVFGFFGNPYANISAIDTSGGIVCSRTSGQTPCFVQVSASAIAATGTALPFEDCDFTWDFGDPTGGEIFVHPVTGVNVNANSAQQGPEAAYVYRSPGTYTITLTITGQSGAGFISKTITQTITVSAYNASGGVWYFDQNATGANNGTSPTDAFTLMTGGATDLTNLTAKLALANVDLRFKRGSSWAVNQSTPGLGATDLGGYGAMIFGAATGPTRCSAYGSGANPLFTVSNISNAFTAFVDNGAGAGSPSGVAGKVMTVTVAPATPLAVGNYVTDNNQLGAPAFISSFGTGTGGTGSYNLSLPSNQNLASRTFNLPQLSGINMQNGSSSSAEPKNDMVFSNIDFTRAGSLAVDMVTITGGQNHTSAGSIKDVYLDGSVYTSDITTQSNSNFLRVQSDSTAGTTSTLTNFMFWNCASTATNADASGGIGLFAEVVDWLAVVGSTFIGSASEPSGATFDHHIYPDVNNHALFRWNNFGSGLTPGGVTAGMQRRNFCINCNWDDPNGVFAYSQYWCIAENMMTGTSRCHDAGNANNDPTKTLYKNFVTQLNAIHDLTADGSIPPSCVSTITIRFNCVYNINNGRFWGPDPVSKAVCSAALYNNKMYRSAGQGSGGMIDYNTVGWTAKQFIRNNILQDDETTAKVIDLIEADQISAGSVIDYNQYWAPNDTDQKFHYSGSTAVSFASWQGAGLDGHGSVANPIWMTPPASYKDMGGFT